MNQTSSEGPVITIITVAYNEGVNLEKTILEVINQNYDKIEYIVIDGGSNDKTIDIIKKYEKEIDYWVSEPDKGIYDAMNKGMSKVTGDWFNFMNVGDGFSSNNSLSKLVKYLNVNKEGKVLACTGIYEIDEEGNSVEKMSKLFSMRYILKQLPHQGIFFKREICKDRPYCNSFKIAADLDLFVKLYFEYGKDAFLYIPEALVFYRLGGFSSKFVDLLIEERRRIIDRLPFLYRIINQLNFKRQRLLNR